MTATVQQARDDLHDIAARIGDLWEHLYAADWQPDTGRASKGHGPRPHWTGPQTVQQTYLDVVAELARAHWALGRGTDVPAHWTCVPNTTERAPTIPHSKALMWTRVLDGMLVWVAAQTNGDAPERLDVGSHRGSPTSKVKTAQKASEALVEACGHIGSARARLDDLWPTRRARPCKHCARPHGGENKWCRFCELAHQPGGSCAVCGKAA